MAQVALAAILTPPHPALAGGAHGSSSTGSRAPATGEALPAETVALCRDSDVVFLGAAGGPKWDEGPVRPEQGLLRLRRALDVYAALMLEHAFRRRQMARAVESAAVAALRELGTPDVGGHATTDQVTEAVLRHLSWSRWSTDTEEEPVGAEWGV